MVTKIACDNFFEGALVMLRLSSDYGYSNTWWRVMFIDNDGTFIGRLERHHWHEYTAHEKGDDVKWDIHKVKHILNNGEQFCYGDNITICNSMASIAEAIWMPQGFKKGAEWIIKKLEDKFN